MCMCNINTMGIILSGIKIILDAHANEKKKLINLLLSKNVSVLYCFATYDLQINVDFNLEKRGKLV